MKLVKQLALILAISFLGEVIKLLLPLPIPAGIYGLLLLLVLLLTHVLPLSAVKEGSGFLLEIMPILFIPSAVGLLDVGDAVAGKLLPLVTITVVSTVTVMVASGRVTQFFLKRGNKQ